MRMVYLLPILGVLLGLGNSTFGYAQLPRTHPSCWIESTGKERTEYGYKLQVSRQRNRQTTLRIYYPWAEPQLNPRYIIRYDQQGQGTWQKSTNPPQQAKVFYLTAPTRWRVVIDNKEFLIYTTKRPLR